MKIEHVRAIHGFCSNLKKSDRFLQSFLGAEVISLNDGKRNCKALNSSPKSAGSYSIRLKELKFWITLFHYNFHNECQKNQDLLTYLHRKRIFLELYKGYSLYFQKLVVDSFIEYNSKIFVNYNKNLFSVKNLQQLAIVQDIIFGQRDIYNAKGLKFLAKKYEQSFEQAVQEDNLAVLYGYAYFLIQRGVAEDRFYIELQDIGTALDLNFLRRRNLAILKDFKNAQFILRYIINTDLSYLQAYLSLGYLQQYIDITKDRDIYYHGNTIRRILGFKKQRKQASEIYAGNFNKYFPLLYHENNIELYQQALETFTNILPQDQILLYLNLANSHLILHNFQAAQEIYEKIVTSLGTHSSDVDTYLSSSQRERFYFNFARTLMYQGDFSSAVLYLERSLELYQKSEYFPVKKQYRSLDFAISSKDENLAEVLRKHYDYLFHFVKLKVNSMRLKMAFLRSLLGFAYWKEKNYKKASENYQQADYHLSEEYDTPLSTSLSRSSILNFLAIAYQEDEELGLSNYYAQLAELESKNEIGYKDALPYYKRNRFCYTYYSCLQGSSADSSLVGLGRNPDGFSPLRQRQLAVSTQIENAFLRGDVYLAKDLITIQQRLFTQGDAHTRHGRLGYLYTINQEAFLLYEGRDYKEAAALFYEAAQSALGLDDSGSLELNYFNYFKSMFSYLDKHLLPQGKLDIASMESTLVKLWQDLMTLESYYKEQLRSGFRSRNKTKIGDLTYQLDKKREDELLDNIYQGEIVETQVLRAKLHYYSAIFSLNIDVPEGQSRSSQAPLRALKKHLNSSKNPAAFAKEQFTKSVSILKAVLSGNKEQLSQARYSAVSYNLAQIYFRSGRLHAARALLKDTVAHAYEFHLVSEGILARYLLAIVSYELYSAYGLEEFKSEILLHVKSLIRLLFAYPHQYASLTHHIDAIQNFSVAILIAFGEEQIALAALENLWRLYLQWEYFRKEIRFEDEKIARLYGLARKTYFELSKLDYEEYELRSKRLSLGQFNKKYKLVKQGYQSVLMQLRELRPMAKNFLADSYTLEPLDLSKVRITPRQVVLRFFTSKELFRKASIHELDSARDSPAKEGAHRSHSSSLFAWCITARPAKANTSLSPSRIRFLRTPIFSQDTSHSRAKGAGAPNQAKSLAEASSLLVSQCLSERPPVFFDDIFVIPDKHTVSLDYSTLLQSLATSNSQKPELSLESALPSLSFSSLLSNEFIGRGTPLQGLEKYKLNSLQMPGSQGPYLHLAYDLKRLFESAFGSRSDAFADNLRSMLVVQDLDSLNATWRSGEIQDIAGPGYLSEDASKQRRRSGVPIYNASQASSIDSASAESKGFTTAIDLSYVPQGDEGVAALLSATGVLQYSYQDLLLFYELLRERGIASFIVEDKQGAESFRRIFGFPGFTSLDKDAQLSLARIRQKKFEQIFSEARALEKRQDYKEALSFYQNALSCLSWDTSASKDVQQKTLSLSIDIVRLKTMVMYHEQGKIDLQAFESLLSTRQPLDEVQLSDSEIQSYRSQIYESMIVMLFHLTLAESAELYHKRYIQEIPEKAKTFASQKRLALLGFQARLESTDQILDTANQLSFFRDFQIYQAYILHEAQDGNLLLQRTFLNLLKHGFYKESLGLLKEYEKKHGTVKSPQGKALLSLWEWDSFLSSDILELDPKASDSIDDKQKRLVPLEHMLGIGRASILEASQAHLQLATEKNSQVFQGQSQETEKKAYYRQLHQAWNQYKGYKDFDISTLSLAKGMQKEGAHGAPSFLDFSDQAQALLANSLHFALLLLRLHWNDPFEYASYLRDFLHLTQQRFSSRRAAWMALSVTEKYLQQKDLLNANHFFQLYLDLSASFNVLAEDAQSLRAARVGLMLSCIQQTPGEQRKQWLQMLQKGTQKDLLFIELFGNLSYHLDTYSTLDHLKKSLKIFATVLEPQHSYQDLGLLLHVIQWRLLQRNAVHMSLYAQDLFKLEETKPKAEASVEKDKVQKKTQKERTAQWQKNKHAWRALINIALIQQKLYENRLSLELGARSVQARSKNRRIRSKSKGQHLSPGLSLETQDHTSLAEARGLASVPQYKDWVQAIQDKIPEEQGFLGILDIGHLSFVFVIHASSYDIFPLDQAPYEISSKMYRYLSLKYHSSYSDSKDASLSAFFSVQKDLLAYYADILNTNKASAQNSILYLCLPHIHALAPIIPQSSAAIFQVLELDSFLSQAPKNIAPRLEPGFRVKKVSDKGKRGRPDALASLLREQHSVAVQDIRSNFGIVNRLENFSIEYYHSLSKQNSKHSSTFYHIFEPIMRSNIQSKLAFLKRYFSSRSGAWFLSHNFLNLGMQHYDISKDSVDYYNYLRSQLGRSMSNPGIISLDAPLALNLAYFTKYLYDPNSPYKKLSERFLAIYYRMQVDSKQTQALPIPSRGRHFFPYILVTPRILEHPKVSVSR